MSSNLWTDMIIWFFAFAGFMLILCDIVRYFMYKDTLPNKLTVLLEADALGENSRVGIANLLNLLYEQNADGKYEVIILENTENTDFTNSIRCIADATDCVYIANAENVAQYIKQSFL